MGLERIDAGAERMSSSAWLLRKSKADRSLGQKFVKPPRVKESAFAMECEVYSSVLSLFHLIVILILTQVYDIVDVKHPDTGVATTSFVIGLIKGVHIREDVLNEKGDAIDPAKFQAVGRLGDISYGRIGEAFRIARPSYEENKEVIDGLAKKGSA